MESKTVSLNGQIVKMTQAMRDACAEHEAVHLAAARARRDFRRMLRRKRDAAWFEALYAIPDLRAGQL